MLYIPCVFFFLFSSLSMFNACSSTVCICNTFYTIIKFVYIFSMRAYVRLLIVYLKRGQWICVFFLFTFLCVHGFFCMCVSAVLYDRTHWVRTKLIFGINGENGDKKVNQLANMLGIQTTTTTPSISRSHAEHCFSSSFICVNSGYALFLI